MTSKAAKQMEKDLDVESLQSNDIGNDDDRYERSSTDHGKETSTGSGNSMSEQDAEAKLNLAKKETIAVFRLRLAVFCILFLAAVTVSVIVYFIATNSEKDEYRTQWDGTSARVQDTFLNIANTKLGAISALGVAYVAHAADHETQQWPFVSLSSFQQRADTAQKQSGSIYVHLNPAVEIQRREEWESFVVGEDSDWIERGLEYQRKIGMLDYTNATHGAFESKIKYNKSWPIWWRDEDGAVSVDKGKGPFFPTWQTSPILHGGLEVNENVVRSKHVSTGVNASFFTESVVISDFIFAPPGDMSNTNPRTELFSVLLSTFNQAFTEYQGDPLSQVFLPVFDSFEENRTSVGVLIAWVHWAQYFKDKLPPSTRGVTIVLVNTCGSSFTYQIDGRRVKPIGRGDLHDQSYNHMKRSESFKEIDNIADGTKHGLPLNKDHCRISIDIYPSEAFYEIFHTATPIIMTCAIAVIFVFTAFMFIFYDRLVERRQKLVMFKAAQTNAIVTSLFPENVRERLMQQAAAKTNNQKDKETFMAPNRRLKGYLDGGQETENDAAPIADLFPHCTVLFADIAGFTAWSSTREPAQVFILLQTVYQAFDKIAKRRKVFKVETIGDSYVAVTGLPEPQLTHAVIMTRFANESRQRMNDLVGELESTLGPDTADLSMRFGLHSGPVTAGVLLGERARFQLFGDTVNTAARMESTGIKNRIQCSKATYDALVEAGKSSWTQPRSETVQAKGKGAMQTYWLDVTSKHGSSTGSSSVISGSSGVSDAARDRFTGGQHLGSLPKTRMSRSAELSLRQERLVNWITDMLHEHIRKLIAMRTPNNSSKKAWKATLKTNPDQIVLDEVAEIIYLPRFCDKTFAESADQSSIDVGREVLSQLHDLVAIIASHYRNNPFHNFEHACHVTMATNKFLKRIVSPDIAYEKGKEDNNLEAQLHNYTHGINSDPLTILAIVFSALIHDVDHRGVSNPQLVKEDKELGDKYRNKSVAEQNSLDIAWNLLMQDKFVELRQCLFTSDAELKRFRQVIVNVVLATDIFDPELNGLRTNRWNKAFHNNVITEEKAGSGLSEEEHNDLRATIVIEHIIQASDVSHTMQHWHIYRKWNKKLFKELYLAYSQGRMAKDPSTFWYAGELGFFDHYIIPLAKKLKECNVFGVASDECLNYAIQNREEWQEKGQDIIAEMMNELKTRGHAAGADGEKLGALSDDDDDDDDSSHHDGMEEEA